MSKATHSPDMGFLSVAASPRPHPHSALRFALALPIGYDVGLGVFSRLLRQKKPGKIKIPRVALPLRAGDENMLLDILLQTTVNVED